ncbi:hypothetical protein ASNO1_19710 [Corallococcus caeni]|uniref:Uncharacterized protein n=1 Tax=Corallococcus caeni TaxID=3082388 RepID=A0ABQ6QNW3_9BACT|nr:hypothetical protein ASNO1_19710 [Corallococcus sp. NO1]
MACGLGNRRSVQWYLRSVPARVEQIPAGRNHWHDAAPTSAMTHLALQGALNGKVVVWMERVTDEPYGGQPGKGVPL